MFTRRTSKRLQQALSILLVIVMLGQSALPVLADSLNHNHPVHLPLATGGEDEGEDEEAEGEDEDNPPPESEGLGGDYNVYLPLIATNGDGVEEDPVTGQALTCSIDSGPPPSFEILASNVGTTLGQFDVNETGEATYKVDIATPPGTGGLTPDVSLVYGSRSGSSLVGQGWSLAGLSKVSRCPTTQAQHGFIDGVDFDDNDQFCLDGQLLVAVEGPYGVDGTVYHTENETFAKIVSYGAAGSGPERFQVQTKAGLTMEYGFTEDSRLEASGQAAVLAWAVNKISDTKGNYLTVSYSEDTATGEHYPLRLDYTGNAEAGLTPYNSVRFVYEERPDQNVGYVGGATVSLNQRLTAIQTYAENELVRDYRLAYDQSGATGRSRLASITECNGLGGCFAPTTFAWQEGVNAFEVQDDFEVDAFGGWHNTPELIRVMDVNGDGLMDLVFGPASNGKWSVLKSTGTDFVVEKGWARDAFTEWRHTPELIRPMDVNGDGLTDLVFGPAENGKWSVLKSTGTDFVVEKGWARDVFAEWRHTPELIWPMDANGDGLMDLVFGPAENGKWSVLKSTGTSFVAEKGWVRDAFTEWRNTPELIRPMDVNGDGLMDFVFGPASNGKWSVLKNTGTSFEIEKGWARDVFTDWRNTPALIRPMDVNGDGLMDLVIGPASNGKWSVLKSTGTSFIVEKGWARDVFAQWRNTPELIRPMDVNGDRMMDLVLGPGETGKWSVLKSTGTSFVVEKGWATDAFGNWNESARRIWPLDVNGDSLTDFLFGPSETGEWVVLRSAGPMPDLLTGITTGHGADIQIEYQPLTASTIYTKDTDAVYPQLDLQSSLYVVAAHESSNGLGGVARAGYHYTGLKVHLQGRGFSGFRQIAVTDEQTGLTTTTTYRQDHPFKSMVARVEQHLSNGTLISRTDNEWAVSQFQTPPSESTLSAASADGRTPGLARLMTASSAPELQTLTASNSAGITYFPYIARSIVSTYELDGSWVTTRTTNYSYDDYGNPTQIVVDYGGGHTETTLNSYTNNLLKWHLGRLTDAQVTAVAPNQPAQTRSSRFAYDEDGLLVTEITEPDEADLTLAKTYEYDLYGNIIRSVESGSNLSRTHESEYDPKGRFIIRSVNALGHAETRDYDPRFGKVTRLTGPNGLATTWDYDDFGRQVLETRADGTQTSQAFRRCDSGACPTEAYYYRRVQRSGSPASFEYYDILDRPLRQESVGFDGRPIYVETEYDERGQTKRVSDPYFAGDTPLWTSYTYDDTGRPLTQTLPDGSQVSTAYQGLTTSVTNALTQTETRTLNERGWLIRSTDNHGEAITYGYDSVGNLIEMIDPAGNRTTMQYDRRGRKIAMTDPDTGLTEYRYNAFDELVWQKDAKGQETRLFYDELGRLAGRTEPEGTSVWHYDDPVIGRLIKVSGPDGYEEKVVYDQFLRPVTDKVTIDGQEYKTKTTYDPFSRVETIQYPTGLTVRHHYNPHGYLTGVCNPADQTLFWQAETLNARGQLESQTVGNGVTTQRSYEAETGRLQAIHSTHNGAVIQDLTYEFDPVGNLIRRTDQRQTLSETFQYDGLNRLTAATVSGQTPKTVEYDKLGNITYRSDVGSYSYGQNGAGPHAVTAIAGEKSNSYGYDANGNRTGSNEGSVEYTSYNKPDYLSRGENSIYLSYGPDRSRYKKEVFAGDQVTTTLYIGGRFELEESGGLSKAKHYIAGSEGVVAIHTIQSDGLEQTRYLHKDHLGSIDTITDEAGTVVERLSFDAWGKRRLPNWQDTPELPESSINRGFTGHEQLDEVGLIHMNGRVYDPEIGRFLSADPFIQAPENTQSLNRYTYVLNNPLSYTDPSGFFFSKIFKAIKSVFKAVGKAAKAVVGFVKEHWRSGVTLVLTVAAAWAGATLCGPVCGGAIGGFVSNFTGTLLHGGSLSDALSGGLHGAVIGAASAGAVYSVGNLGVGLLRVGMSETTVHALKIALHGVVGGTRSVLQGGKFEHGFLSAAFTEAFAPGISEAFQGDDFAQIVASAVVGGTAAEIGGGKFANGAITGAYTMMFNQMMHTMTREKGLNILQEKALDLNNPNPRLYWNVRIELGDPVGTIGLCVVNNSCPLGVLANKWLAIQAKVHGVEYDSFDVSVRIMRAHHAALLGDTRGIPGLLSATQVAEYHHQVFTEMGLPKSTFGGTPAVFDNLIFGIRPYVWCSGCDPVQ